MKKASFKYSVFIKHLRIYEYIEYIEIYEYWEIMMNI